MRSRPRIPEEPRVLIPVDDTHAEEPRLAALA